VVARSLLSQGQPLQLWVASAGYGLVRPSQQLKPYSATFSLGPDSVLAGGRKEQRDLVRREWWASITRANLGHRPTRTLCDVVASDPGATLLVALSEPYVQALHDDLVAARAQLRGGGRLLMISAGTKKCPGLDDNLLPVDAGLQSALGGSRLSLNVRIARHLVATSATHGWATPAIVESLSALRSGSNRPRLRRRMTDAEIVSFIIRATHKERRVSRTDLLRRLRTQGLACEQQRFAGLFDRANAI
jgi:hypothetical protein